MRLKKGDSVLFKGRHGILPKNALGKITKTYRKGTRDPWGRKLRTTKYQAEFGGTVLILPKSKLKKVTKREIKKARREGRLKSTTHTMVPYVDKSKKKKRRKRK